MSAHPERPATVSVIVPCRNEERYIGRCLDSIVNGEYPHDRLEVLVVEGRSDDRTRAILDDYVTRYPMIRVVYKHPAFVIVKSRIPADNDIRFNLTNNFYYLFSQNGSIFQFSVNKI